MSQEERAAAAQEFQARIIDHAPDDRLAAIMGCFGAGTSLAMAMGIGRDDICLLIDFCVEDLQRQGVWLETGTDGNVSNEKSRLSGATLAGQKDQ